MDDLASKWERSSHKAKEHDTVDLPSVVESNNRVLVSRLFTKRRVNLEALTRTLQRMWCSVQTFEGHESFASHESIEQLHRLVFVLGITHVIYSASLPLHWPCP
ncbi:hypothetical protein SO802_025138 [Lithocarpus litseifolius]|uniref:Uncharacterized protein n=1 Tax=Lithocarpus litseifolius TaxID=425828 RepID=A0AAW2BY15_9ROSI